MNRIARAALRFSAAILAIAAVAASAETNWVKDELRLNLRSGPGNEYRIKGYIKTGDSVTVLSRREGWVQVRTADADLGDGSLSERVKQLEAENGTLKEEDVAQKEELESLTRDNMELKAGARWPEWITGACLLAVGMLMGAIVQSMNGRRARPRIRL